MSVTEASRGVNRHRCCGIAPLPLSYDALVRLNAACIVGSQDSPYALDGARRAAELSAGLPEREREKAQAAVARQGDAIIPDLERANISGPFPILSSSGR